MASFLDAPAMLPDVARQPDRKRSQGSHSVRLVWTALSDIYEPGTAQALTARDLSVCASNGQSQAHDEPGLAKDSREKIFLETQLHMPQSALEFRVAAVIQVVKNFDFELRHV